MWNRLRKYLSNEIVIEYKACLYFFCLLVFYCVYLLWRNVYSASILYMVEMVLTSYIMGYLQNYVFHNFDEAERLGKKEVFAVLVSIRQYLSDFAGLSGICGSQPCSLYLFFSVTYVFI